ncbi:MAG TPA: hypothetical protein VN381_07740, partial [Anaerovoracaceae bacterium]|nr:hypothetical protein [Anaerovoracaceae bacterium]
MSSECFGGLGNDRNQGIQDILNAKSDICKGLEDLSRALKDLRCGKFYEAQKNLVDGIHYIKEGVRKLEKELLDPCQSIDHRTLEEIEEAVCILR